MAEPGVLTVTFQVEPGGEELIGRWYDEEHIPDRLAIPGFRRVRRFRSLAAPLQHRAVWDVDDAAWPFDPEYRSIPHDPWAERIGHLRGPSTRVAWEEVPTTLPPTPTDVRGRRRGLRVVEMDIPPEHEVEFNRWYDEEHIPDLMRRPEYLGLRRFRMLFAPQGVATYTAMWELSDVDLHQRPDYEPPPVTEWTERIAAIRTRVDRSSWAEIPIDPAVLARAAERGRGDR